MGLSLFKKKSRNRARRRVAVDRQAALAAWRALPEFRALVRLIGTQRGAAIIQMCDDYIARMIRWQDYEEDAHQLFCPMMAGYYDYERRMILDIAQQITRLWGQCDNCELRHLLDRNALDPNDWRIPTGQLDDDLWKGVNWVNSHDPSPERRRRTLRLMMILQRGYDPREKRTFETANVELVGLDEALRDRMTNTQGRYPSSVGADWLASMIEALAMTVHLGRGDGDRKWDDLACFLYGAYIRAQSAPDGNKRTARAIYVATLRKGGREVRVPNRALEAILLGPNWIR